MRTNKRWNNTHWGKCFTSEEVGHLSRNCPSRNQVAGGSSSKPPGIPSFSMTIDLIEDVDDTDILESMLLGMIMMDGPESTCFRPNSTLTSSASTNHIRRSLQALPFPPSDDRLATLRASSMKCGRTFGWRLQRHHCSLCGRCICASCSGRVSPIHFLLPNFGPL